MPTTQQDATRLNGWNTEQLHQAVEQVRAMPEAGRLQWRSRAVWDGGFGLDVRTEAIEQMGEVMPRAFTLRGDHPPELLGANTGPTAIETLLAALGSCVVGTFAAQATAKGVPIEGLELEIVGAIDLNGFFGLGPVAPGLSGVRLTLVARGDADATLLEEILAATCRHSPVYDTLTRPISVDCQVMKAEP